MSKSQESEPVEFDLPESGDAQSRALARFAAVIRPSAATETGELGAADPEQMRAILERLGADPEILARRLFPPPEERRGAPRLAEEVLELLADAGVEEGELDTGFLAPPPAASEEELEQQIAQAAKAALKGVERPRKF